jgi:UDP-2,4-diacetamido-2,4,6-trideoxy-beta-L-altropyranose hydrolase
VPHTTPEQPLLLVRADAGPSIGGGHVARCTAVATAWNALGGRSAIATATPDDVGFDCGERVALGVGDLADLAAAAARLGPAVTLIDHYGFDPAAVAALALPGVAGVVLDGPCAGPVPAVVVNHNPTAAPADYPGADDATVLLLGERYALVRPDVAARAPRPPRAEVNRIVVVFGASDPRHLGLPVGAAIAAAHPGVDVAIVAGPLATWDGEAAGARVLRAPDDYVDLLASADVVVTAAGGTCWELARLGVPAVAVVTVDNQEIVAAGLRRLDLAEVVDRPDVDAIVAATHRLVGDPDRRADLGRRGPVSFDGRGAERVAAALRAAADSERR